MTDEELYRRYLDGDEAGLSELMKKYGDALTLYIDGYLGDIHEAEDLMIEVFSYLLTKRPHIREGGLKAYLYKAARHMALRHKSRRPAVFSLEDLTQEPEAETLIEEVVKDRERSRILHLCMGRLHRSYREDLYLTSEIAPHKTRKADPQCKNTTVTKSRTEVSPSCNYAPSRI